MAAPQPTVLILGAGINGAAIAREMALNGVGVVLVDTRDLSFGATSYASRLIHGGLRYLEYGEFDLVRESLAERTRLLRLAPQYVRPLRLFIPIENRFGGLWTSAARFLFKGGRGNRPARRGKPQSSRGLWLVRFGLRLYDEYARDPQLPKHETHRARAEEAIHVNSKFRWLCSYYDAQIRFPERFVVAMLEDARRYAAERGTPFEVLTYHRAALDGRQAAVASTSGAASSRSVAPAAIINATGAWVDMTLQQLKLPSERLMGGTKGSHVITWNKEFRAALAGSTGAYAGIYAEAADGRPVFVLPFGDAALIGTTDERYEGDPARAVATQEEIDYLLATADELLPQAKLTRNDVDLHYSGVRPLPYVSAATPAGITRRHALTENRAAAVPLFSVIGGKLTTCRSLAEEVTATVLSRLGSRPTGNSEDRPLPGAEGYPHSPHDLATCQQELAARTGFSPAQIAASWELYGTRTEAVLRSVVGNVTSVPGTNLPEVVAQFAIRHEWVHGLDDLVERRLMLLYHRRLYRATLARLAEILASEGVVTPDQITVQVEACVARLSTHFGKRVFDESP